MAWVVLIASAGLESERKLHSLKLGKPQMIDYTDRRMRLGRDDDMPQSHETQTFLCRKVA